MRVTWDQALAWRMRRQLVDPRGDAEAVQIIGRLCGVQAQVASAAELAVAMRQAEPEAGAVGRGLADGAVVKTWAMRGTLHLLRASDAPAVLSLIASARSWEKPSWQRAFGTTPKDTEALAEVVTELLDGAVLTRDELVAAIVARKELAALEEQLRSGWGMVLKPLAWQGLLCHGPSRGAKVTFTRPDALVPGWTGLPDPDEAAPVAIAAYLGAFGPATPEVFDAWLYRGALKKATLRGWFAAMGERLTAVDVDGDEAYILSEHAEDLARAAPSRSVRLLGAFDQYVLGPGTGDARILPAEHRAKVSRAAGRISPIVVVGGRVAGVWELADDEVSVSLFPGAPTPSAAALEAEVEHVRRATGRDRLTMRRS
jgi:Winged helix DNA-binding domain